MIKQHTDFTKILDSLINLGFTERDVADQCGMELDRVCKLRWGVRKHPTYDEGCAIMRLYEHVAPEQPAKEQLVKGQIAREQVA